MDQAQLFPMIRNEVRELLGNYIPSAEIIKDNDEYIVPPVLGPQAGVLGAVALAQQTIEA